MKLTTHALRSLILPLILIFGVWAAAFYFILSDELIDEVDDQLEVYSEQIIRRYLAGETLPDSADGSNNTYFLRVLSTSELGIGKRVEYEYKNIYVASRHEDEPARVMHTVFECADGSYRRLTVMTPVYERNEVISTILVSTFILLVAMLLVVIAVFAWVFVRHTRPLYRVLRHLDDYRIGHHEPLVDDTDVTEFSHLIASVNDCIDRVEEAYERERRFIGDASHELQTPLAICQNRIELMMDDPAITEQQMGELAKMQQTISELIRLNKSLLFLSKIENNQYIEQTAVSINEKVHRQADLLAEVYASRDIRINVYDKQQWTLTANDELIGSLVANLLRNACLHNVDGGTVDVYITDGALSISNTDDGEPLDSACLFNRFYKAHHGKRHSNGLGLSIVKAICEVSNLTVTYSYESNRHCFMVASHR